MKPDIVMMKNIERLGDRYCYRFLTIFPPRDLEEDWWSALNFFFSKSFMRGRRDKLSNEYNCFTVQALAEYFRLPQLSRSEAYEKVRQSGEFFGSQSILAFKKRHGLGKQNSLTHPAFSAEIRAENPIVKLLMTGRSTKVEWDEKVYSKKAHLGNAEDVMMVMDVLQLVATIKKRNLYVYFRDMIRQSGVREADRELRQIRAVSDKITSFIIRDIALLNPGLIRNDYEYAFPIDTWVGKITHKLGCKDNRLAAMRKFLLDLCKGTETDPLKFAAGIWYLGFNSLDILIEQCIGRIEIENTLPSWTPSTAKMLIPHASTIGCEHRVCNITIAPS